MKPVIIVKDHYYSNEEFAISASGISGILETQDIPENIKTYYDSENYISHKHNNKESILSQVYFLIQKINFKSKLKLLTDTESTDHNLLDFGCGNGAFLDFVASKKNWKLYGFESNLDTGKYLKYKDSIKLYSKIEDIPDLYFDTICLWHVFEHLPSPTQYLEFFIKKLKPKGRLILAVPNFNSYDANYYAQYWAAWDVPRHLYHFSQKGMKNLIHLYKDQVALAKIHPLVWDAFYISITAEKYRNNTIFPISGTWIGLKSNIKAIKSTEYSSLVYCIEKK